MQYSSIQVARRLDRLLEDLIAIAPSHHREPVEGRLATVSARPDT
jgi:hypothetical protein